MTKKFKHLLNDVLDLLADDTTSIPILHNIQLDQTLMGLADMSANISRANLTIAENIQKRVNAFNCNR